MVSESEKLAEQLEKSRLNLIEKAAAFESLQHVPVYSKEGDGWTVLHIIKHLQLAETEFIQLFQQILDGGNGVAETFSIDGFNRDSMAGSGEITFGEAIARYSATREKMIEFVKSLTDDQLQLVGRHPFFGMVTLEQMIKTIPIHTLSHLRDVQRAIKAV